MAVDIFAGLEPVELYGKIIDLRYEMVSFTDDETGDESEQEKIVLEIQDLARDMDWNHTPRFTRASARKENSKWNSFMTHMSEIGYPIKGTEDLVGHCFRFNIITLNPEKGQFASRNYPKPIRNFETEAECIAAAGAGDGAEIESEGLSSAQKSLIEIAHDHTFEQILTASLSDDTIKGDSEFISALINDRGPLNDLVDAGYLSLDGEKYEAVTS